ncbi:MAG: hypothetical protein IKJ62_05180 [Alphaproteobacteria bacterium]|nr:hypothetical protein [Alphaproteobacteria bacterium]
MRKIESIFITTCLIATVAITGVVIWNQIGTTGGQGNTYKFPNTNFGTFLAAQHAIHVNDFEMAAELTQQIQDAPYPVIQSTIYVADFLSGRMPTDAATLKNEKSMPAQLIYDAYLIQNDKWKELHNRHKSDEAALTAPIRIWSAIANDWRTNTFKFIEKLPTNDSWKNFVRGQIYAELGNIDKAAENFARVSTDFMNINDFLYIMSFYMHYDLDGYAQQLATSFTNRPGGLFMTKYENIPDWSVFSGYKNQMAFSLVQNVSHTQMLMYSDLSVLLLRFAELIAPDFAANNDVTEYYLGNYFFNNSGDWAGHFDKISDTSPFKPFAVLKQAEKTGDMSELKNIIKSHPLFVPAINKLVAYNIQHGNKRAALRVVNNALKHPDLNELARAFFVKNRAHIYFVFGDMDAAQADIHDAAAVLIMDPEILALQAKIWANKNRELNTAYEYAMTLVQQNPTDISAWDTLGYVVAKREGVDAALEVMERVGEVSETCSELFEHIGDMYAAQGDKERAKDAYRRAIELSDDGLTVAPIIERKIRKLK